MRCFEALQSVNGVGAMLVSSSHCTAPLICSLRWLVIALPEPGSVCLSVCLWMPAGLDNRTPSETNRTAIELQTQCPFHAAADDRPRMVWLAVTQNAIGLLTAHHFVDVDQWHVRLPLVHSPGLLPNFCFTCMVCISPCKLWLCILNVYFPTRLVELKIRRLYRDQHANMRFSELISDWFKINKGVRPSFGRLYL